MAASPLLAAVILVQKRRPELRGPPRRKSELSRKHTHNRVSISAQRDRLAYHIIPPAESLEPGSIAQHHNLGFSRLILSRQKVATQHRLHAQRAKESIAHARRGHRLCARGCAQQITRSVVNVNRTE